MKVQSPSMIQVLIVGLPRMLHEIVLHAIAAQPDMEIAGEGATPVALASVVDDTQAWMAVVSTQAYPHDELQRLLRQHPNLKVLALAANGRSAFLYVTPGHELALGEVSPPELVEAIRKAFTQSPTPPEPRPAVLTQAQQGGPLKMAIPFPPPPAIPFPPPPPPTLSFGQCDCKTPFPPGDPNLNATLSASLSDTSGNPIDIIQTTDRFTVHVELKLCGSLLRMICGKICFAVFLDEFGDCPDITLPGNTAEESVDGSTATGTPPCVMVKHDFTFGPIQITPPPKCSCPYQLVVVATFVDTNNKPGPIACHCPALLVQFFQPGP